MWPLPPGSVSGVRGLDIAVRRCVAAFAFPADGLAVAELVGVGAEERGQLLFEAGAGLAEQDAVLRALGAGDAGLDLARSRAMVCEYSASGESAVWKRPCSLEVRLDERDLIVRTAGEAEVAEGFRVDGEDAAGGAVFGRHVGDGGAIGEGQLGDAGAVELDELADDAVLAQHLGDGEDEVGGGGAFAELAGELEADDLRDEHGDGLAEHGGFGFDAADAPAEDAEAVDHGGVGVGADEGVGVGLRFGAGGGEDDAGEVFEIDLVADAHAGRDGGEVVEGRLSPLEEGVALAVALEFERGVERVGVAGAVFVDLDGVVDDQLGGLERVDLLRIAAEDVHGVAHGGEVDDGGDAGEVLHEDAGGHPGDFAGGLGFGIPPGEEFDVVGGDGLAVFVAEEILEQDAEAEGQAR